MAKWRRRIMAFVLACTMPIASAAAQSAANLSLEQQTKIADAITREAGPPMPGAQFSLAIGNTVPAGMQLHPMPPIVAQVAPQFRDASYIVVEEHIAIVDSNSRKVLEVVQRGLSQTGTAPGRNK